MKRALPLATALVGACLSGALQAAPIHTTEWTFEDPPSVGQVVVINKKQATQFAIVAPKHIFFLNNDAIGSEKGRLGAPLGTFLVPINNDHSEMCELTTRAGSAFACLKDKDKDGKFDHYFGTQVFNSFFFGSIGDDGGFEDLRAPVEIRKALPSDGYPSFSMGLKYKGHSKSKIKWMVCVTMSGADYVATRYFGREVCSSGETLIKQDADNNFISIYGTSFAVKSLAKKELTLEVVQVNANNTFRPYFTPF